MNDLESLKNDILSAKELKEYTLEHLESVLDINMLKEITTWLYNTLEENTKKGNTEILITHEILKEILKDNKELDKSFNKYLFFIKVLLELKEYRVDLDINETLDKEEIMMFICW